MNGLIITGIILGVVIMVLLIILTLEYSLLVPATKGLPILMYHKISSNRRNGVTVLASHLEKQFRHIREKGYKTIFFSEIIKLMENHQPLPEKSLVLTFDDAYENFRGLGLILLKKYNFKATVFVPAGHMGKSDFWDKGKDAIMKPEVIRSMAGEELVEIGIHSFMHSSFSEMSVDEMREDLTMCYKTLKDEGIPYVKVLAYPFGAYPKKDEERKAGMKKLFQETGLAMALRIGNRINVWPLQDPYEVKRIDIKGTDSFLTFKIKLKKGRKKLFS